MNEPMPIKLLKFDANGTLEEVTKRVQHAVDVQIGSDPDVWQQLTQQIAAFAILNLKLEQRINDLTHEYNTAMDEGYEEAYQMVKDVTEKLYQSQTKVKVLESRVRLLSNNVIAAVNEVNSLYEKLEMRDNNAAH